MVYGILTTPGKGGMPFEYGDTPPTAPGEPLRVSESGTLLAFVNQPDRVFASRWANAYGKILWQVTEEILHQDDLPAAETFSSCQEFQMWLSRRDTFFEGAESARI